MAKTKSGTRKRAKENVGNKAKHNATRRKILGGIKRPHKKTGTEEEKRAFKVFLKRLEDRDIKLQESGNTIYPNAMDKDTMYEVEEILDASIKDGKVHFFVLWKNHMLENCTWEPESNLGTCMDLIDEFYVRFPKKAGGPEVKKACKVVEE